MPSTNQQQWQGGPAGAGWTINNAPGGMYQQPPPPNQGWSQSPPPYSPHAGPGPQTEQLPSDGKLRKKLPPLLQLISGGLELALAVAVNIGQMLTSFYATLLAEDSTIVHNVGWWRALGAIWQQNPAHIGFALLVSLGAQTLLHTGCQKLVTERRSHQGAAAPQHPLDAQIVVEIIFSEKFGAALAGMGLIIDTVGDGYYALTSGLPFLLYIIIVLLMNSLATWGIYDGGERFHLGWIGWHQIRSWKWAVKQVALEKARGLVNRR